MLNRGTRAHDLCSNTHPNTLSAYGSLNTGAQTQGGQVLCNVKKRNRRWIKTFELEACAKRTIILVHACDISSLIRSHMLAPLLVRNTKCKCASCFQCYKTEHSANQNFGADQLCWKKPFSIHTFALLPLYAAIWFPRIWSASYYECTDATCTHVFFCHFRQKNVC